MVRKRINTENRIANIKRMEKTLTSEHQNRLIGHRKSTSDLMAQGPRQLINRKLDGLEQTVKDLGKNNWKR